MFAIGLLSLFSVGLAVAFTGGDDDVDPDQIDDGQDQEITTDLDLQGADFLDAASGFSDDLAEDEVQEYDNTTRNSLIQGYVPTGELDEETDAQIADFLDALDPGQPIDEAASAYRDFVTGLGIEILSLENTSAETPESIADADAGADEPADADEPEEEKEYDTTTRNNLIRAYVPIGEVDEETNAQIAEFLEGLDTAQPIDEASAVYRDFVTGLGIETFGNGYAEDGSDDDVPGPPMGEEFRDPLVIADELEAQRILDEIAAEEARQPVNLVTVRGEDGTEISDNLVLSEQDQSASGESPAFTVTAPDAPNAIDVGYDDEHTFAIEYNVQTITVTAGLNSQIESTAMGLNSIDTQTFEAADGTFVTEHLLTRAFDNSTDITIEVNGNDVGMHVAEVGLTNPNDTLHFEFNQNANGAFHLFFHEGDDVDGSDSVSTKRAFIVQTASTQTGLSATEVDQIANQGLARISTANVLAEIYLGDDLVESTSTGDGNEIWLKNFINDNPQITANIEWASISSHDDTADQGAGSGMTTTGGNGSDPDAEEDDINTIISNAGLNPAFFGF
ncbi:hypothetical protein Z945_3229 [Sulfitobacter noctilucae]|uniref:hypothetical protein n=1 Tax=Sulfitobacter noctilucae TaxID=1342302 RepID=UPI0004684C3A|nr:hypothetical protein [Sulfitobacter noctilucae]KIN70765.1 hypothetical protein Z945_3229 [Sulfitobacter noctilucae]